MKEGIVLFFKNKDNESNFIKIGEEIGQEVIKLYCQKKDVSFDNTSELERQIISIYLFGLLDGIRQNKYSDLTPVQVKKCLSHILESVLGYSLNQANDFTENMISNLQNGNPQNTIYAIIHRGLDGYFMWIKNKKDEVVNDIYSIVGLLQS